MSLCRGRRELVIRLLSRPLRVEVERVSAKSKVLKTLQLSLDRFVLCCVDFFLIWTQLYAVEFDVILTAWFVCLFECRFRPRYPARPSSSCSWLSMRDTSRFRFWLTNMEMPSRCLAETAPSRGGTRRSSRRLLPP